MNRYLALVVGLVLAVFGLGGLVTTANATEGGPQTCVPSAPWDETIHHDAVPATPDLWWNWSPNKDQGPFDGPPAFPNDDRGTWQGPHENGGPDQDMFGTFNSSNGENGRASWFHREHGNPGQDAYDEVIHHKGVYCQTPAPVLMDSVDECGTENDVPASLDPAESPFWTAVDTGTSFVVTANDGYYFSQTGDANGDLDDLVTVVTLPYTPLTDVACPTPPPPSGPPEPTPPPHHNPGPPHHNPGPPHNNPGPPHNNPGPPNHSAPPVPTVIDAGL